MRKKEQEIAKHLLSETALNLVDSVRLVVELLEESSGMDIQEKRETIRHCRRIIQLGSEAHKLSLQSVPLKEAVEALLESRKDMRERTKVEIRQVCARFIQSFDGFENESVRNIDTAKCREALEKSFCTLSAQKKAKRIIYTLFTHSIINGWCASNPMAGVVLPRHKEKPIHSLMIEEVLALLKTAEMPEHVLCAPAVGIMLWAGIRPHEVEQLKVSNIHYEDRVITVPAKHAKTGGARQVTLQPVLIHWLRKTLAYAHPEAMIVPGSWSRRWSMLRKDAGFKAWPPDVLRHTFASYHLKYFKDMQALQLEMGHASPALLRTRYLAMEGVTAKAAGIFWNYSLPRKMR